MSRFFALIFFISALYSCVRNDISYYKNGNIKQELKYRSNKLDGIQKWYFEDGSMSALYNYEKGVLNGKSTQWNPNGTLSKEYNYKDGLLEGQVISYANFGSKISNETYVHGKKNGVYKTWHRNGILMIEGYFKNDFFDSIWNYYDEYGRIVAQGSFKDGGGTLNSWFPNGLPMRKATYKDNEKEGNELIYNSEGELISIEIYSKGKIIVEKKL